MHSSSVQASCAVVIPKSSKPFRKANVTFAVTVTVTVNVTVTVHSVV
jgi:hypothetical protein